MTVPVRYLTDEEAILIHERILAGSGGAGGIRDWGLLDSAVQRPRAVFGGEDVYPDLFTKAAALGHFLVLNHPFVDGNKRTAWEAMHTMVEENVCRLRAEPEDIVALMLRIADKTLGVEKVADWLRQRTICRVE